MADSGIRSATITRKTKETDISMRLLIDGTGKTNINTGIGFFDHMLNSFAKHGLFDLDLSVKGDLIVDCHHTIEDVGIVLGEAIKGAIGNKQSIRRYGDIILPMDESLILCAIDLSGRPYLVFDGSFFTVTLQVNVFFCTFAVIFVTPAFFPVILILYFPVFSIFTYFLVLSFHDTFFLALSIFSVFDFPFSIVSLLVEIESFAAASALRGCV